jgi:hypothetical protein
MSTAPAAQAPEPAGAERIWARLARPFDPPRAAEALLGMRHGTVRVLAGALHATSPEVVTLLYQMPVVLRSLGIATTNRPERCHGEIRVQWSETMSGRGATAGAYDLFVCSTTSRAYDTPENRMLVAALRSVVGAARVIERGALTTLHLPAATEVARHARRNAALALRYLDHRALSGVDTRKPTPKEIARVRASKRARTYLPALAVLDRGDGPGPSDVEALSDARTLGEHSTLADVLDVLDRRGHAVAVHVRRGALTAGPVTYAHPDHPLRPSRSGIRIAGVVVSTGASAAEIERSCAEAGY